jgi:PmbA protein
MLNKNEAYEIIDFIARNSSFYTTVNINFKEEGLTRFANSEIHQNVYSSDTEVVISVIKSKKVSIVTTNVLNNESLLLALKKAEEKLDFMPEGEIELPELSNVENIEFDGWSEALNSKFDIEARAEFIREGVNRLDKEYKAAGSLSLINTSYSWGNTKGVKHITTNSEVSFTGMIMHESGASSYIEKIIKNPEELDVIGEFDYLYNRAKMAMNPLSIEPGYYDVILEPMAVGELIVYTGYLGFSSKFHQIGMSCFTGKLGTKVLGDNITIRDDYRNPNTKYLPFDFEGYERKPLTLVDKGTIKEIAYDTITAIKAGQSTTGHSVGAAGEGGIPLNIVVEKGDSSIEEMIKATKKGLLVTRFHYMNIVNPIQGTLTALTRDGLFLIENGKIKQPVYNLRFTDSIERIFSNVEAISKIRASVPGFEGSNYVPALKIKDFHFTGKTVL